MGIIIYPGLLSRVRLGKRTEKAMTTLWTIRNLYGSKLATDNEEISGHSSSIPSIVKNPLCPDRRIGICKASSVCFLQHV